MAQETPPSQLSHDIQWKTRQDTISTSISSGIELDKPSSSESIPSRSPRVLNTASHISQTTSKPGRRCTSPQSVSFGPQNSPSRGNVAGISDPTREVNRTSKMKRVSKAKKGKKVHACEFGCGKIFTRKEHQKRHEANHNSEFKYPCDVEGCQRAFQRKDLLARHMDKQHNMAIKPADIKSPPVQPSGRRSSHTNSEGAISTTAPVASGETLTNIPENAMSSSGDLDLGPPAMHNSFAAIQSLQPTPGISQLSLAPDLVDSVPTMPDLDYGVFRSCGPNVYTSSCSSPMSDLSYSQTAQSNYLPHEGKSHSTSSASSTERMWGDLDIGLPANDHFGGAFDEEGSFVPPVGTPTPSLPLSWQFLDVLVEPSLPVSRSGLDGDECFTLRRPLVGEDGLFPMSEEQVQHCLGCYRKHFDPLFPIIHHPTVKSGLCQRRLVAAAMIAIGAQFSPRENAKIVSASLHEKCLWMLASQREPITSRSRVSDQQSIILLEALSRYRGRGGAVQMSSEFRTLYISLLHGREELKTYPPVYSGSRYLNNWELRLEDSRKSWIDHETKRRILLAAFVLDTHQYAFFQEPSCYISGFNESLDLPSLCSSKVWECSDAKEWRKLVSRRLDMDITRLENGKLAVTASIDPFESSVIQCSQIQIQQRLLDTASIAIPPTPLSVTSDAFPTSKQTLFTQHALQLATLTPIQHLLLVSGESWLFGTKVTEQHIWADARTQLRPWVDSSKAAKAVWHAAHLLRLSMADEQDPLNLLHEQWCTYLAALVCWAFGYTPRKENEITPIWTYLTAMSVAHWQEVHAVPERWYTRGLLESVRAKILGPIRMDRPLTGEERSRVMKPMGRLLYEAEEVLFTLVEGRTGLVDF